MSISNSSSPSLQGMPCYVASESDAVSFLSYDEILHDMTLDPPLGTYVVLFSCDLSCTPVSYEGSISLYVNGAQEPMTIRRACEGKLDTSLHYVLTLPVDSCIEVKVTSSPDELVLVGPRCLTLIKIA